MDWEGNRMNCSKIIKDEIKNDYRNLDGDIIMIKLSTDGIRGKLPDPPGSEKLRRLAVDTGLLATYIGRRATIRIIEGDASAWPEFHRSRLYQFWEVKLLVGRWFYDPEIQSNPGEDDLSLEVPQFGYLISYYLATGEYERVREVADDLIRAAVTPQAILGWVWKSRCFEPFALRLYQKIRPIDLPPEVTDRDLQVYGRILEAWDHPDRLGEAIHAACDYHCERTRDRHAHDVPEFDNPPTTLVPAEIAAIYKVREQLGLETPKVSHPLLETGLFPIPAPTKPVTDEVIDRIAAAYEEVVASYRDK